MSAELLRRIKDLEERVKVLEKPKFLGVMGTSHQGMIPPSMTNPQDLIPQAAQKRPTITLKK